MSNAALFTKSYKKRRKPIWLGLLQGFLFILFAAVFASTVYHAFQVQLFNLISDTLLLDAKFLFFLILNVFIVGGASLVLIYQWAERDNIRFRAQQLAYRSLLVSPDYYRSIRRVRIDQVITDITKDGRKLAIDNNLKDSDFIAIDDTLIVKKARQTNISFKDGKLDGNFKTYFNNGNLLADINYKDGKLEGSCCVYYPNGIHHNEKQFKRGQLHGVFRAWDEEGALFFEIEYQNDVQHGCDKIYRKNGIMEYEDTYEYGKLIMRKIFDESGRFKYYQKYNAG
ncbi:MAG: toxin-antitoxin system YwqK family antitoxin [Candidatus Omnitrophota bacterium]